MADQILSNETNRSFQVQIEFHENSNSTFSFRTRLTHFLVNINFAHFFYSNMGDNIDLNENASCWSLIEAILVRCLPQNLLIFDQQWLTK